jgi:putative nucleotidyltransferase with HDIG domain
MTDPLDTSDPINAAAQSQPHSTLKKIAVSRLQLGMHLHSFEGSWVDHPFWRSKFLLDDPADLERARSCDATHCWIDESRGLPDADRPGAAVPVAERAGEPAVEVQALPSGAARSSLEAELRRASTLCRAASAEVMRMFGDARMGLTINADRCMPLVGDIADSLHRNSAALVSLSRLKTHDDYTYMHCVAVCALMIALGRQLGLDEAACREAGMAGLLHDIGKAMMPADILNKPGKLDEAEFKAIQEHPLRGHELLVDVPGLPATSLDVCLHHHERFDGSGYPHGLAEDGIGLFARMGALCDVYDAVTSDRPYKAGWNPGDAVARMAQWKGHFDPELLKAFIHSVGIYPIGSIVRLESQRVGVVIAQNQHALTRPVVKVFFSLRSRMPVPLAVVDLCVETCKDRIGALEELEGWNQREIAAMWAGGALPKDYKSTAACTTRE